MESIKSEEHYAIPDMSFIYLDHSTTTPVAPSVRECMQPFLLELYGHPSSQHWMGRAAAEAIEDSRCHLASLLNAHPSEIIFTSGGTESINLALLGVGRSVLRSVRNPHCIISNLEHQAVVQTAQQLQREGWQISVVHCNQHGFVDVESVARHINEQTRLISITHASYQLGTIQPIASISQLCIERDIIFHTDAAQAVGKIPCQIDALGVDLLSLSGHKFYAPKGIGALFLRLGIPLEPIGYGDWLESGLRPGTQNVADIVALGQAAKLAQSRLSSGIDRVSAQRNQFHAQLENLIGKPIPILGRESDRLPGALTIQLPGVNAHELQQRLPDICFGPVTIPSEQPDHDPESPLVCLGLTGKQQASVLRIAIGWSTSDEELNQAAHRIASSYESLLEV